MSYPFSFSVLVLGVLLMQVFGMFWYSSYGVGTTWARLTGMTHEKKALVMKQGMLGIMLASVGTSLLSVLGIWGIIVISGTFSLLSGMYVGIFLGLTIALSIHAAPVIWEGKPVRLFLINTAYSIVSFAMVGALLGGWTY